MKGILANPSNPISLISKSFGGLVTVGSPTMAISKRKLPTNLSGLCFKTFNSLIRKSLTGPLGKIACTSDSGKVMSFKIISVICLAVLLMTGRYDPGSTLG